MSNNFSNLVDLKKLEDLLKQFSNTMGIAISILDNPSQEVLISVNWNNLCKNFYRNNLEANKNCIASDQELYEKLKKNPKLYISTCKNGLIHGSIPIIIDNEFLAVLHIGQVFFDIPDLESFKKQAAIYGFDEKPFIDAIKEIPITSKDQFKLYSQTLDEFAIFIGEMGKANKLLKKEISEKIKAEQLLQDSLCKLEETNIKLQETHINKNKFISDMSHELRTPLNAIIGFSQTLNMQYFGNLNDKQTEYVKLINKSGLHLLSLINDILDLSKIDAGKMDFSKDIFLASDYINENISMIKPQLKSKNITLEINTDKQPVEIIGDKRKCNQIMLNLLSNAFKYTPENGKIIVSTKLSKTGIIEFSVIDNGVGIKKEDHNKIFEEFYQADHDRDQALGGAGIGLALTKKLVNLHKGSIGVKSKPGKGSKFWFTLPINS